jgi:excisionase family DNA binding protein
MALNGAQDSVGAENASAASGFTLSVEQDGIVEESVHVKQAARLLGISASLVYAYVERKQIPHYRMGRSIRFLLSELVEWRKQFHVNGGMNE